MSTRLDTQRQLSSTDTAAEPTEIDGHSEHGSGEGNLVDDDDDDDDDKDADAEAEEIARRLNDQLWAEISKAQAEAAAATKATTGATSGAPIPSSTSAEVVTSSSTLPHPRPVPDKRVHEALKTMRIILKDVANDPLARATLSATLVPGMAGVSVLDAFSGAVASNAIPKDVARPLSHLLVSLARSDALFAALRHSEQSSIQLELGKRQRDEQEHDDVADGAPPLKRHFPLPIPQHPPHALPAPISMPMPITMPYALHTQLDGASRAIISALTGPACPPTGPPPPQLIASIQFPLHQVFLFAMTATGPARNALQELGGLIQALGVLSGVPIGGSGSSGPTVPWAAHPGTSVHPCGFPGCGKTFARLYSLRAHTRIHAAERPFRCTRCPASFARNHDLKRHERLHEDRAWQCTGCAKAFSRRDALTRHRNTAAARHSACATADIAEIDVPRGAGGVEDELRRTRMWHEASDAAAAAAASAGAGAGGAPGILEEGELPRPVLAAAHEAVARLHPVLQACVSRALGGAGPAPGVDASIDATGGQATLASALARAQAQLSPGSGGSDVGPSPVDVAVAGDVRSVHSAAAAVAATGSSLYGLSPEQAQMLERAIASAASAAQLQAEAEAALEEEEEEEVSSEGEEGDDEP